MRNHRKPGDIPRPDFRSSPGFRPAGLRRSLFPAVSGVLAVLFTGSLLTAAPAQAAPAAPDPSNCAPVSGAPDKRQMRATWISSVYNIDWPSEPGLSPEKQKAELVRLYDEAASYGLNAVFVQIRPTADAFWPSPHEPWSQWLTGRQGADPGYDPLEFAVSEAHKRNLEFHGWFNPYRVAMHDNINRLAEGHPARKNRHWVFEYGGRLYYNPGIPKVRSFVQDAMMHAVENYDMDGVHFDDYFYPYPAEGQGLPDRDTYARYGGGFDNIHDWRRNNVDLLVKEMNERIEEAAPHVKFGISPFGIWRNARTDPNGSRTDGFESYDRIYADSRKWVLEGWLDYINPQVYWEIGHDLADYAALVPWWADLVDGTDVHLYIGQAAYKVGEQPGAWQNPAELSRHLTFNQNHPRVDGDVYFSADSLRTNAAQARRVLVDEHYSHPALVPVKEDLGGSAPPPPAIVGATRTSEGVELTIEAAPDSETAYYAVYRFDGEPAEEQVCDLADPRTMVGTVRSGGGTTAFTDPGAPESQTYYVTALDRLHHESDAGRPRYLR
ncbi:glycoside hydrolase family 10 protein [Allosalinactinospora lopnorensis]|uniref:glycoside hydrolase family 10 protein n=1 Tax=Allosalinactinospora lopnorensis TaxID=1352348 RepID=UPI0009E590CD|nr:family 10 glycosylhydrolase [Allosalinactinospora lopnorensis]